MSVNKPVHGSEEIERRINEVVKEIVNGLIGDYGNPEDELIVAEHIRALIPSIKQEAYRECAEIARHFDEENPVCDHIARYITAVSCDFLPRNPSCNSRERKREHEDRN